MTNSGGVEHEVGTFLYGMVRVLKPRMVLETGTYLGASSSYIAQGLKDNNIGTLVTLEINEQHIETSKQLWHSLDLMKWIKSYRQESLKFEPVINYDMMFLDSEMNLRLWELIKFYPNLTPGGYVFIHDFPNTLCYKNVNPDHPEHENWPVGKFPPELDQYLKEDKLRLFHFPNPRGMIGFYRPKLEDYKWVK